MAERVAKEVKDESGGRIDIQVFANSQLGSGKEMIESTSNGALQMTTDGAGALGASLPQLSVIEAPYLWRDAAHDRMPEVHAAVQARQPRFGVERVDAGAGARVLVTVLSQVKVTSGVP
jgi:TRAP-type C4-dicarboxylate transport system substrate-binding protein